MSELARSAQRVQDVLDRHGMSGRVVQLPASTRSAREAADAVGCEVGQIAKSILFRGARSGDAVLVVASGAHRVDDAKLAAHLGEGLTLADAAFVKEHTGYAIGGVPPVGHPRPLRTVLDRALLEHAAIWAAAGTPHAVFRLAPEELVALTGGEIAEVG